MMDHARAAVQQDGILFSRLAPAGDGPETVGAMLVRNATSFAGLAAYGERGGREGAGRFRTVTWRKFLLSVAGFGRFLHASGVRPGDRVLVLSRNCAEMLVAELATMSLGAIYVPVFPGYAEGQRRTLLEHAAPTALIVATRELLERIAVPPSVRVVVTLERTSPDVFEAGLAESSARLVSYPEALAQFRSTDPEDPEVRRFFRSAAAIDPVEPCLMMYTSGTSGELKGVLLSHDNILSQQRALAALRSVTPQDRFLSYLPWHHSFGGIFEKYTALANGATLYLDDSLGKDFELLRRNWIKVRPTIYFSIPKLFQQLVAHVQSHPEDAPRIFHPGLRFVFTAAAPLPANLSEFFAAKGIPVLEGWGLTETSPCCTVTDLAEPRTIEGMVGYPIPGVRLRLAADREILVQGPNVMLGYYRNPAATARALPGDGWFHTGDLGEFVGAGLRLIARKDRVFKLLNAEKVVPTAIENRLAGMNPYIRYVIVAGDGRSTLAALIFPDFFRIREEFGDDRPAAERVVKESLRKTMQDFNRDHPVKYERIAAFVVIGKELSIDENELTPSLKVRVHDVLQTTRGYLDAVYEPSEDCDCRFLRKVLRLGPDDRRCFAGKNRTLDRCHECGSLLFDQ